MDIRYLNATGATMRDVRNAPHNPNFLALLKIQSFNHITNRGGSGITASPNFHLASNATFQLIESEATHLSLKFTGRLNWTLTA